MNEAIGRAPNRVPILILIFLNMLLNLFFIILDMIKICLKKSKSKMSSLEKFLNPLSLMELIISIFWCVSAFLPFNEINDDDSTVCKVIGFFQILFYEFEFVLIHKIVSHLKHLIINPLNYILKSKKELIKSLLLCSVISIFFTLICFFSGIIGKSPMNSCFIQFEFLYGSDLKEKIALLFAFLQYLVILAYTLYKIIIVIRSIQYNNDKENQKLFKAHVFYLISYLLIFMLFMIIYLTYSLTKKDADLDIFTFIFTLLILICQLILGILRFYKNKIALSPNKLFKKESMISEKALDLIDIVGGQEEDEKEHFESSAIKKFVMNFYISVCFCLEKNLFNSYLLYKDLNEDMINEENTYTITQDIISKELPSGELVNDVDVKSREKFSVTCVEYAPKIFSFLRQLDKISEEMIIKSMLPMNNKTGIKETEGKGGSFFINSDDYEFIMKTITENEKKIMIKLLQNKMVDYFRTNNNSIICRIYGVYSISIKTGLYQNEEIYFILMKNVIGSFYDNLLCKYDLKGSVFNRKVQYENVDKKVLKDINFNEVEEIFLLNKNDSKKLLEIVEKDSNFLCSSGIMDYSLLVAKISLNNDEIKCLFGMDHRRVTEAQFLQMIGQERTTTNVNIIKEDKENIDNEGEIKEKENLIDNEGNDKIRFKEGNIASLKKYMFPSLKADIVYIMSIIDYFQLFTLQKNLENKYKKLRKGVKKEDISSIPPDEYKLRFIEFVKQKTDSEDYLKKIYDPQNKNDF